MAQSDTLEKSMDKSMENGVLRELPDTNTLAGGKGEGLGLGAGSGAGKGVGSGAGTGIGTGVGFGRGAGFVVPEKPRNNGSYRDSPADFASRSDKPRIVPPSGQQAIPEAQTNTEHYGSLVDPAWQRPMDYPLSTFSIDVDNASYSNIRRMIRDGQNIPKDAVRIEECINAFDYNYAKPTGDKAFAVHSTLATCPWNEEHLLMQVGIKGREIPAEQRPASNLVFLIDVSGSMQEANKLPLVKESLRLLFHQLDERDSVSLIVYAGRQGVILPPTKLTESGRVKALGALGKLEAGGSTNGGAGILRAYEMAKEKVGSYRLIGYANRVLKDEDFNNDQVDAGDIGAGHTVTAFYEIVPADQAQPPSRVDPLKYQKAIEKPAPTAAEPSDEWLTLKLRHKSPEGDISSLQESVVKGPPLRWQDASSDFNFASSVALFGRLRDQDERAPAL